MSRRREHQTAETLIGRIYDAALDPQLWPGVAPQVADAFGATSCLLQSQNRGAELFELLTSTANFAPRVLDAYSRYFYKHDLWVTRAAAKEVGRAFTSDELVPQREFVQSEMYVDWCRKLDIFHLIGAAFPVGVESGATSSGQGTLGIIGIHRPLGTAPFDASAKRTLQGLLPHLQRALQIRQRLTDIAIERQASLDALDHLFTAILVVDRSAKILYANDRAAAVLRAGDALRSAGRRLTTVHRAKTDQLMQMIQGAADAAAGRNGSSGGGIAISREDQLPLSVLVAPFRPAQAGLGAPQPAAILFIRDPEAPTMSKLTLQSVFGLTPAEASIASALADGKALNEIAAAHAITQNTVRTHLKKILAKTGTSRQAQLVALLLRSVAGLGREPNLS